MSILVNTLVEGVSGTLRDSAFARMLLDFCKTKFSELDDVLLASLATSEKPGLPSPVYEDEITAILDLRLLEMKLCGIRKFPAIESDYYAVSFSNGLRPISAVFLGSNGVGKSSVYSALEYIGMMHLPSAVFRGCDDRDSQFGYLKNHGSSKHEIISRTVQDGDKVFVLDYAVDKPLSFPAYYCMEQDVVCLSHGISSTYIAEQLGLTDYLNLLTALDRVYEAYNANIELYTSTKELIRELEDNKPTPSEPEYQLYLQRLDDLNARIHRYTAQAPLIKASKRQVDEFVRTKNYLSLRYNEIIDRLMEIAPEVFNKVFSPYFGPDISEISFTRKSDSREIEAMVSARRPLDKADIGSVLPQHYLNTFRFKIFCVAFKVSLAICCTKIHRILFPIVIDDVFDSSDFSNREQIRDFIHHLFEAYQESLIAFEGKQMPALQLIFFTQDDVIADSVYRGIADFNHSDVKYSRMFDYYEASNSDRSETNIHERKITAVKIEDVINANF